MDGSWSNEYRFDDQSALPLLITGTGEPTRGGPATTTFSFTWLKPTPENIALLTADTTGLTQMEHDPTTWSW